MGCYEKCYSNSTIYVAACTRVGLFPLRHEAAGYVFKHSLRIHSEEAVYRYEKGGEMAALPEATLNVFLPLLLLHCLYEIHQRLVLVGEGISVNGMNVVNTVHPSVP